MQSSTKSIPESSEAAHPINDLLTSMTDSIDATAKDIVSSLEKRVRDVGSILEDEFSKKPVKYISTCLAGGVLLGFMLGQGWRRKSRIEA